MYEVFDQVVAMNILTVIAAVLILVVGWVVALIIAAVVRAGLRRTTLSKHLAKWSEGEDVAKATDVERWGSKLVFYVVMFFVLIAFFQYLGLTIVAEPLNRFLTQIFAYLPMLFGALILVLLAWLLAGVMRMIVLRALMAAKVDERLGKEAGLEGDKQVPLSQSISKATYWLIFLLFLPAILTALKLEGLLLPVQNMTDRILTFMPQILAAALILLVGWFAARILMRVTAAILVSLGLDRLSERTGLAQVMGEQKLSSLLGLAVYAFVLIVTIIAALNALALEAITRPASNMLNMILAALPAIFVAGLILLATYLIGRVVKNLLANLLAASGFDTILERLGITGAPVEDKWKPSEVVGYVALVIIMLFAVIEAASLLGFGLMATLISQLLIFISMVVLGLIIFGIGLYLANLAYRVIKVSNTPQADLLAKVARIAILILAGAMALQRMGLADEIILIAFGLILGTGAVTVILAFGLGGKDIAARQLDEWIKVYKSENTPKE